MITLQGYTLTEKIYESKNSAVYRALCTVDNKPVIIKALKEEFPSIKELTRYRQEFELCKDSGIDGVIKSYDFIPFKNGYVIIFEDFGADSLRVLLDKNSLSLNNKNIKQLLSIALNIVDILIDIHSNDIIHKDINPSNIVMNIKSGELKIIDFGISTMIEKERAAAKKPELLEGTLAYISPEQTGRINRLLDYRTDLYSLGVSLYEIFTGRLPFECNDLLELIHLHIAKEAIEPVVLNGNLPGPLSGIIMKLLEKDPENRYMSAIGVKNDLKYCLENAGKIFNKNDFIPGENDCPVRFIIPQKLYGRVSEVEILRNGFERIHNGIIELILVSGYSGIGKTSLIHELLKPAVEKQAYFITGKFEQYKKDIPYYAFIQAFKQIVQNILTEGDDQIAAWKETISQSLGNNGKIITEVIPELELIVGTQPDVQELPANESKHRFNFVFQNFIKSFASVAHPLIIFLDDLHWADLSSLKLLEIIMSDSSIKNILILGAYRDNEVNETHPLILSVNEIKQSQAYVTKLQLGNLNQEDVKQLINDAVIEENDQLSSLLMEKTHGNPYFINQLLKMLYTDGLIRFNTGTNKWESDINQIKDLGITDNVVDLLLKKIINSSDEVKEVLKTAACIGNVFDLSTLSGLIGLTVQNTAEILNAAIKSGFIYSLDDLLKYIPEYKNTKYKDVSQLNPVLKFQHDRVQQVAYSLLEIEKKKSLHVKIGNFLLSNAQGNDFEEMIFDIVNHLNAGIEILSEKEREKLSELNFRAAICAKQSAAFQPAYNYLKKGAELLHENIWHTDYRTALKCFTELTEIAYINSDYREMEKYAEIVIEKADEIMDKIRVYEIKLLSYQAQHKLTEAVFLTSEILKLLGYDFPTSASPEVMQNAFVETAEMLAGKTQDELVGLPAMTDPSKLAIIRILANADTSFYQSAPDLYALSALSQIRLSLIYGNAPESACGYATYGVVLCGVFKDIEGGFNYGQLAMRLIEKYETSKKTKVMMLFHIHMWHHKNLLSDSFPAIVDIYKTGCEIGDIEFMAHTGMCYCNYLFFNGVNLKDVHKEIEKYGTSMKQTKQNVTLGYLNMLEQLVINLRCEVGDPTDFNGKVYSEKKMMQFHYQVNDKAGLFSAFFSKMVLHYLFGNYKQACLEAQECEKYVDGVTAWVAIPPFYLFAALSNMAVLLKRKKLLYIDNAETKKHLGKSIEGLEKLKAFAQQAPSNYKHKQVLIEALLAQYNEEGFEQTVNLFDAAIELATENNFHHEQALANELAAEYFLSKNKQKMASAYLKESLWKYEIWGATNKLNSLREKYEHLIISYDKKSLMQLGNTSTTTSGGISSELLDLKSVLKTSQIIAGEIVLEKLLGKMMETVIENAGAQKGVLILNRNGQLFIEVESDSNGKIIDVLKSIPLIGNKNIPSAIVNYVSRTGKATILHNAADDGLFTNDDYVIKNNVKSVFCAPLFNQGKLIGVLYLENNLVNDAFTEDKQEILNLLSSQIAVSIENATLYNNLEQKVKERTVKIEEQNKKLIELDKFKEGMMSMIVHDLKNPLNSIINIEGIDKDKQLSRVRQSGKQMLHMVSNILDVYKYEDTNMHIKIKEKPLKMLIDKAIEEVSFLASRKFIEIRCNYDRFYTVRVDSEIIERVFINILTNAIKYSPVNSFIIIKAALHDEELEKRPPGTANTNMVKITITDNGQGIPKEKLNAVFEKFVQVDAKKSGEARSTGIGLNFSKMAIEAHGGEIGAISNKGKGATFWFTLEASQIAELNDKGLSDAIKLKSSLALSDKDKQILGPFAEELKNRMVYQTSKIREILKKIDAGESETLQIWIDEVEKCLFSVNEDKYNELVKCISEGEA